jgi:predicted metal-dependent HD superfamily phosphohydrolase
MADLAPLFQRLLNKWKINNDATELLKMWNQPHRRYHGLDHLRDLVDQIQGHSNLTVKQREKLLLAALYHDLFYDPQSKTNEYQSAEALIDDAEDLTPDIYEISYIILDTEHHEPVSPLSALFSQMDMAIVTRPYEDLLEWEYGIAFEYSFLPIETYIDKRTAFLNEMVHKYPQNADTLKRLIKYVEEAKYRPLVV